MGFALHLALRYLRSRRRGFISVSTLFAVVGVALGTAALVAVMSVTGGVGAQFQKKVLGVNGHVTVLRSPFGDYRPVLEKVRDIPDVLGVSPFLLNPMMLTREGRTVTGVTVKGVDPQSVGTVLDLPEQILTRGFSLDPKVYFIDRLPVQLRPHEFALTGAFAMVACVVATLWPALHAARLRPVDAFRGGDAGGGARVSRTAWTSCSRAE